MQLPAEAVAATAVVEVVRLSARPERYGDPMTGPVVSRWTGREAADSLALISSMAPGEPRICFAPGWGLRAYDAVDEPLFELIFCFSCHHSWLWGQAVPPGMGFDTISGSTADAEALLAHFRDAA
ncbi:hypothetical protein AB0C90_31925 [Streptomyces sp. NPDC048550]|uniref:hypothetical protein n=1 Tax=unclassified Streptomyces TaxID=2593676 RepID=UPI000A6FF974|nr:MULTISPECIES: hypothetical protein [unclassified Streptomyces]MCX5147046.1 hypothetical protein [Streptomyces sp. NBC_00320]WSN50210.1 hypothetical protein OG299_22280 [Streptomyces sp. NBC_01296]WSW60346.1 hypothetical protein OG513_18140 [Streptomyces sp. NBC_00998]